MQSARTFQIWSLLALPLLLPASCGPGLPSDVPLGGTESPTEPAGASGSSRARDTARAAASPERAGEGGADDEAESDAEQDKEADDTLEVTATPSSPASENDKDKDKDKEKKRAPAASVAPAGAPACDDSSGSEPDCAELESGACGAVFGPLCEQLGDALKPKIATVVVQCLVENNRRGRCESVEECLERGLADACVLAPDRAVCQKFFDRCDPPEEGPWQDVGRCAQGVAALKPAARVKVVECLEDGCDLETCFLKAGN
ncbi:MAG TPA: hypothetical protein VFU02_00715 [Polyangiaceae bacterium]|nr:hypothetical protein [Polyangiaceae bacterium]